MGARECLVCYKLWSVLQTLYSACKEWVRVCCRCEMQALSSINLNILSCCNGNNSNYNCAFLLFLDKKWERIRFFWSCSKLLPLCPCPIVVNTTIIAIITHCINGKLIIFNSICMYVCMQCDSMLASIEIKITMNEQLLRISARKWDAPNDTEETERRDVNCLYCAPENIRVWKKGVYEKLWVGEHKHKWTPNCVYIHFTIHFTIM